MADRIDPKAVSDTMMIDALLTLLDVQENAPGYFTGRRKPGGEGRVFGGQVIGQALMAATRTVAPGRDVHSLHAYFMRPGSEDHEIDYRVDADFDGGSFSNRRVVAFQQGEAIFNLTASFHRSSPGLEHASAMPDVVPPERCPTMRDYALAHADRFDPTTLHIYTRPSPFDMRPVGEAPLIQTAPTDEPLAFWFRTAAPLNQPQATHRAIVALVSDISLLSAAMRHHGNPDGLVRASIDHAVWFHGDMQADDWLLYVTQSPWAGQGRGLGLGAIYDRAGNLVASTAQEGLMRPAPKDA